MPTLKNPKWERFCVNIACKMMGRIDAITDAGYHGKDRTMQSRMATNLMMKPIVKARVEELLHKAEVGADKTSITSLHEEAIEKAKELLNSDNPQVVAKIITEILSRTEPVVRQSQNLTVTVTSKDREKRMKLFEEKRAKLNQVVEVKEITQ